MLVSFRVENFRSFTAEQEFSLVASTDDLRSETLVACDKFALLRSAVIFGANASGKSNLLKAFDAARNFVKTSATEMNLGDPIDGMAPFQLDRRWREMPCRFEVTAFVDDTLYVYGFSADSKVVHSEHLFVRRPGGRLTRKFLRERNCESGETKWVIQGLGKKDEKFLRERTRENALLLSRAADFNFEQAGQLFRWFNEGVISFDFSAELSSLVKLTAKNLTTDTDMGDRVLKFIRDADLQIGNLSVRNEPVQFPDVPDEVKREMVALQLRLNAEGARQFPVETTHLDADGKPVVFSLDDESNGTQRSFAIAGPLLSAIDKGTTLIIDELECSMHPLLTRKIVELVNDPDANPRGAQLIFATHDSSLLDASLFRRDQIWLAEKRRGGATELYSLYDIEGDDKPRKAEAFEKQYLTGRYGGIPNFGPILEDLEVP